MNLERLVNALTKWLELDIQRKELELKLRNRELGEIPETPEMSKESQETVKEPVKEPVATPTPTPATPHPQTLFLERELAAKMEMSPNALTAAANQGRFALVRQGNRRFIDLGAMGVSFEEFSKDPYLPFETAGMKREADNKACNIPLGLIPKFRDLLPRNFAGGISRQILMARIGAGKRDGLLYTYKLGTTEFVNIDELLVFSRWYVENYHRPNKSELRGHDVEWRDFAVHENDLIWAMTHRFTDRLNPSAADKVEAFTKFGDQSTVIRGVRYYKRSVLDRVQ